MTPRRLACLFAPALVALAGCFSAGMPSLPFLPTPVPPDPGVDTLVLTGGKLVSEQPYNPLPQEVQIRLSAARDAYRKGEYGRAEGLFGAVADREQNPPQAVQEAMFYRAECLRQQQQLPKACDTYSGLLAKFPSTTYREQCCQRMYDIACYWLDDTWDEMKRAKEGKSWVAVPDWFHFGPTKPFFDREGRAVDALEKVRMYELKGPLADQALYRCGVVKMYREDWREADHYFSLLANGHPDSKLAPRAIQYAIHCKQMATGGSDYDGRKTAEARKLIQVALSAYPEIANDPEKRKKMDRLRRAIDLQQAEKEFKMAEFYRRTGHPGSAYFYYVLVQRRYPDTTYARKAAERWNSLREELERQGVGTTKLPTPPAPAAGQPGK